MKKPDLKRDDFYLIITSCLKKTSLSEIKNVITQLKNSPPIFANEDNNVIIIKTDSSFIEYSNKLLQNELEQILNTKTIERTKYYIKRLLKSLSEKKVGKINELNLNRWKEYDDIITDSSVDF